MANPASGGNRWQRWILFIRAVYDRTSLVEVKDVKLVPLHEVWLGDFVEETGHPLVAHSSLPRIPSYVDVVQDAIDVIPAPGLSDPALQIKYEDGHWTVGE
jgi:hypothetical protein